MVLIVIAILFVAYLPVAVYLDRRDMARRLELKQLNKSALEQQVLNMPSVRLEIYHGSGPSAKETYSPYVAQMYGSYYILSGRDLVEQRTKDIANAKGFWCGEEFIPYHKINFIRVTDVPRTDK